MNHGTIRIVPLGGLGEIGLNFMLVNTGPQGLKKRWLLLSTAV